MDPHRTHPKGRSPTAYTQITTRSLTNHTQMDAQPAHLNRDPFRDSFKGLVALEIILDLPFGFPINNIISRARCTTGSCGASRKKGRRKSAHLSSAGKKSSLTMMKRNRKRKRTKRTGAKRRHIVGRAYDTGHCGSKVTSKWQRVRIMLHYNEVSTGQYASGLSAKTGTTKSTIKTLNLKHVYSSHENAYMNHMISCERNRSVSPYNRSL